MALPVPVLEMRTRSCCSPQAGIERVLARKVSTLPLVRVKDT